MRTDWERAAVRADLEVDNAEEADRCQAMADSLGRLIARIERDAGGVA